MIYGVSLFFGLFNNLAIFIVLITVYSYLNSVFHNGHPILRQTLIGISFGSIAIICMQVKIPVLEGVFVDQRNAIVILGGAFGGPLTGLISAVFAGTYRISLGGAGVWGGCLGVILSAIAGGSIHAHRLKIDTVWKAACVALLAAVFILPGFLPIVSLQAGWVLMKKMAIPYGSAIFVGVFFSGLLMALEEHRLIVKKELYQSERQYRELFESLIDVSVEIDQDYMISIISPSCEQMFGYAPSELIGRPVKNFYKDTGMETTILEILRKDGYIDNFEVELRKKDDTYIWTSVNAKTNLDKKGNIIGFKATARDISQIKKTLEEKTLLQDNLRQMQKMESIGTLAGGIAHDFNNSLAGIIGGAELLREGDLTKDEYHRYASMILTIAERAGELTRKLLAFSRKGTKENRPVDMATVINDTIAILQRTIDKKITIVTRNQGSDTYVMGDDALLQSMLLNIGINAEHAMVDGGSLIFTIDTVELDAKFCIRSSFDLTEGTYLTVEVADNGCGMSPEVMSRIFEPFFTTKEQGKGTGLGLAAVFGTVQDHHGAITVSSEEGKGTVFTIYLPLLRLSSHLAETELVAPKGCGTILLVDDEEIIRMTAAAILTRLGYTVLTAENGKIALSVLQEHRQEIRLVILDMIMPVMGGRETVKILNESDPSLPVVISSGFVRDEDIQALLRLGIADFIRKPFRRQELAELVARVLSVRNVHTIRNA